MRKTLAFPFLFFFLLQFPSNAEQHEGLVLHPPAEAPISEEEAKKLFAELERPFTREKGPFTQIPYPPTEINQSILRGRYMGFKCSDNKRGLSVLLVQAPGNSGAYVLIQYPKLSLNALATRTQDAQNYLQPRGDGLAGREITSLTKSREAMNDRVELGTLMDKKGLLKPQATQEQKREFLRKGGKPLLDRQILRTKEAARILGQDPEEAEANLKDEWIRAGESQLGLWKESLGQIDHSIATAKEADEEVRKKMQFEENAYSDVFVGPGITFLPKNSTLLKHAGSIRESNGLFRASLFEGKDNQGRVVEKMETFQIVDLNNGPLNHSWGFEYAIARRKSGDEEIETGADGKVLFSTYRCW
jgi:hypothetical protein